jgi:predicted NAD/FAD-binding protein
MHGSGSRLSIAVVGTGISGMAASWLLAQKHDVTVFEQAGRIGGHSLTIDTPAQTAPLSPGATGSQTPKIPVDMGFIVYNPPNYPNLTALFHHLGVATQPAEMSFAASLRGGALEYSGSDLSGLFAQKINLLRPSFWSMLRETLRFYRQAAADADTLPPDLSLGDYLAGHRYCAAFIEDHLLPMAAAIWSSPSDRMRHHPAAAFIRFCQNHGLLLLRDRPEWRSVTGGSREYVRRLIAPYADRIRLGCGVREISRLSNRILLCDTSGARTVFDHVVIAAHSDQALSMLSDPSDAERALLGAIAYRPNSAVMHRDQRLMPRRRRVWSSWNYLDQAGRTDSASVTYWMNRLQRLPTQDPVFVTLNPATPIPDSIVLHRETMAHPEFDATALRAQRALWSLQGQRNTWFCGAWFGAGFHEDGLQAGLAVAEQLGQLRRPWTVPNQSARIALPPPTLVPAMAA